MEAKRYRLSEIVVKRTERSKGDLESLKQSLTELGLINPITVRDDKSLIAGHRRFEAAKQLDWNEIDCRILNISNEAKKFYNSELKLEQLEELISEQMEIEENVQREQLSKLEESIQLAKYKENYERLHPETKAGGDRKSEVAKIKSAKRTLDPEEKTSSQKSAAEEVATRTGKHRTTITREMRIGKALKPYEKKLQGSKVAKSKKDLYALSDMLDEDPNKFGKIVEAIAENPDFSLYDAKVKIRQDDLMAVKKDIPESIKLTQGDFRKVCEKIESKSVHLVFTDPPYNEESIPLWNDLADVASRVLVDGGFLITYAGQRYLDQYFQAFRGKLRYFWTSAVYHTGEQSQQFSPKATNRWKPVLIFTKGEPRELEGGFVDFLTGEKGQKESHEWAQSEKEAAYFIEKFSKTKELVLDPMMGSGSTMKACVGLHRKGMGIEIDESRFNIASGNISLAYEQRPRKSKPMKDSIKLFNRDFRASRNAKGYDNETFWEQTFGRNAVDLIFTDPGEARDSVELFHDLSLLAQVVLKPGGYLLTYSGNLVIDEVISKLSGFLSFYMEIASPHSEQTSELKNVKHNWSPIWVFTKGGYIDSNTKIKPNHHELVSDLLSLYDDESPAHYLIERFSEPGQTVLDPLMGTGMTIQAALDTGRKAIGFEKDKKRFNVAQGILASKPETTAPSEPIKK